MTTRQHGSPAEAASGSPAQRVRRQAVSMLWSVRSRAILDRSADPADTVLVLGSARSGTTWVGEVLDRHRNHRMLFEPLRPGAVPAMAPFDGVRYLPPGTPAPAQRAAMSSLLSGRVRNPWVDHTNRTVVSRRRLVKEIRANCLAPWLAETFPMCPLVMVLRHPLAVAASRRSLGWTDHLEELRSNAALRVELGTSAELLDGRTDPLVRSIAAWVVETALPVRHLGPEQAAIALYEELDRDPLEAFGPVLTQVGQEVDPALERAVARRSRTARPDGRPGRTVSGGPNLLELSPAQRTDCDELLRAFDLDRLYDLDDPAPRTDGVTEIRQRWSQHRDAPAAVPRASATGAEVDRSGGS